MANLTSTSLVDLLTAPLPVGFLDRSWPGSVRLVVIDTNVLLLSLRRFLRDGRSAMLGAAKRGGLKLFAAQHVYWETLEKIPLLMPEWGFDSTDATRVLVAEFLPWVRFVNVHGIRSTDGRESAVLDLDDRPTAVLLSLLAPAVSISQDPHLVTVGLAFDDWLPPLLAGAERGKLADGAMTVNLTLNLTIAGANAAASGARRWPSVTLLLAAGGAVWASWLVASGRLCLDRGRLLDTLGRVAETGSQWLDALLDEAREHGRRLDAATVYRVVPPSVTERLGRMLALEPRARTHVELAEELGRLGETVTPVEVLDLLNRHPSFFREGRWGWRLGHLITLPTTGVLPS